MKKTFWLLIVFSVFLPLAGLTLAGGYLFQQQKAQEQKQYIKAGLKKDSLRLSKKADQLILSWTKEIEQIVTSQTFPEKSLFSAVALLKGPSLSGYEILIPIQDTSPAEEKDLSDSKLFFQKLTAHLPENLNFQGLWLQDFTMVEKQAKVMALVFTPPLLPALKESETRKVVGFIEYKKLKETLSLLSLNDQEAREALLLTSQGWLLFHTNKKNAQKKLPSHSLLGRAIDRAKNQARFVKWEKRKSNESGLCSPL